MAGLPTITHLAPNFVMVEMPDLTLWFSYRTLVAFQSSVWALVVRENVWGPTTGKHLNHIDGGSADAKARRLPEQGFEGRFLDLTKGKD